jgi:hypothetical protein
MSHPTSDVDAAIVAELRSRVAALRARAYEELALLADADTDTTAILGKRVTFTVFRESQADRRLLILVRSDRPIIFGLGTKGTTEGFYVLPNGEKRDAYGDEISEFFA